MRAEQNKFIKVNDYVFNNVFTERTFARASMLHSASAVAFSASIILLAAIIVYLCLRLHNTIFRQL